MQRVPDKSGQEFSTNFGNLRIASKRWSASREFWFSLPSSGSEWALTSGQVVSRDSQVLALGERRVGGLERGRKKGGQGPRQGESVLWGIGCGPALQPQCEP
ncbi:unnamed protein product [Rangifer tarandus platyrhynchus]|uniref:Uncharacterized protein n=1 Tax=Rangifer tarandus platyrhynchus TaxID=3082113 RepID=A0AC59ZCW2_RANTA